MHGACVACPQHISLSKSDEHLLWAALEEVLHVIRAQKHQVVSKEAFMSLFDYPAYKPLNRELHRVDTCATTLCDCENQTILNMLKKSKSGQKWLFYSAFSQFSLLKIKEFLPSSKARFEMFCCIYRHAATIS